MSDRAKQIERMLRDNGFKLERMNGHYVYVSPKFAEPIVMACSPSDHRASENLYHELKRVTSGVRPDASGRRMPSFMTQVTAARKIKALPKARKGAASNGSGFYYDVKILVELTPEQRAASKAASDADSLRRHTARTVRRDERRFVDGCVEFCCTRINAVLEEKVALDEYTLRNLDALGDLSNRINDTRLALLKKHATVDDIPDEIWDPYTHSLPWPEKDEKSGTLALAEISDVFHRMDAAARDWETLRESIQARLVRKKSAHVALRQKVRNIAQWWLDAAKDGAPGFYDSGEPGELLSEGEIIFWGIMQEWHRSMAIVKREPTV